MVSEWYSPFLGIVELFLLIAVVMLFTQFYSKDNDKRKLIFIIGFLFSSLGYIQWINPELNQNQYFNAFLNFAALPIVYAVLITSLSRIKESVTEEHVFKSFLAVLGLALILILLSVSFYDSSTLQIIIPAVSSVAILITLIGCFKTRDFSSLLFLFSLVSYMIGGIMMSNDSSIELIFISHAFGFSLIFLAFFSMEKNKKTLTPFSIIQKQLERAENKLRLQNSFLKNILESLSYPFYVVNVADYSVKMGNSASGFDSSMNNFCYAIAHKLTEPCSGEHACPLNIVVRSKEPVVIEHVHYDKDGNHRVIEVHAHPMFDNKGNVVEIIEYCLDITDRKKAELMLIEAEKKHRILLDSANVLVQSVNPEGKYVYVNEEWKKVLGYDDQDLDKISLKDVIRKDQLEHCMDVFKEVMKGKSVHDVETVFIDKYRKEINVSGNACPIFENGVFVSTVAFFVDITQRKKDEAELSENRKKIESINEKLRVVGNLTRHDVKNKLTMVTTYAYLLKKKYSDETDIMDGLGKMEIAVRDSVRIFNFAKDYEQLGVEELTMIDVEKAVDEAVALFSDFQLEVVNECAGLTVLADSLVRQLFYNLMDNTLKYGKNATTVKVYYERLRSGAVKLLYEDDGVGIPEEYKSKLFVEGFSTGRSSGFGLFLISRMMEVYGWSIEETGKEGKGARFEITIPNAKLA